MIRKRLYHNTKNTASDPYEDLVIGIVRQAKHDVLKGNKKQRNDAIRFFRSEWFEELTGMDGREILRLIWKTRKL